MNKSEKIKQVEKNIKHFEDHIKVNKIMNHNSSYYEMRLEFYRQELRELKIKEILNG